MNNLLVPYLKKRGWAVLTSDLENDKKGIDLFVRRDKRSYKLQVKADERMHQTGNLYLQDTKFSAEKNVSDVTVYMDVVGKEAHFIKTPEIIENWDAIIAAARVHKMPNSSGGKIYHTVGRIIALDTLAEIVLVNTVILGRK